MKNKTKQYIVGIAANIFFLPPIYFAFINEKTKYNWTVICLSFLPLIIVLGSLWFFWGSEPFKKTMWEEEGYSCFSDWLNESKTSNAKFYRFNFKYFLPALFIFSIIALVVLLMI